MLAGLLVGAVCASAGGPTAGDLEREGRKAERSGDIVQAYLLFSQAAALEPQRREYWLRAQALQRRAALLASQAPPAPEGRSAPAATQPGTSAEFTGAIGDRELDQARRAKPPVELKASSERRDLDLRGDARTLFEQVAEIYRLKAVFDPDYRPGPPIRFRLDDAGYIEALRALEAATASFMIPVTEQTFLVAQDTQPKRAELEPTVSAAIPLPAPVSLQEAQELTRAVQQAMALQRIILDSQRRIVLVRDRVSKVGPAKRLFEQLLRYPAQVAIEVELLEFNQSASTGYGLSLQTLFPLVNFGDFWNSEPVIPAGFNRFLVFGGGATFLGLGVTDAQLFARMSRSLGRTLLKAEIRSVEGQPASLHVGDRYPIITAAFVDQGQGGTSSFPPTFNFEDLGVVVKVTPRVHGADEVSLELEAEFRVLTGQAVNSIPVISSRKLQSQVRLRGGEWAVVAGLVSSEEARAITGPAGLSSLPVLGRLFRENTRTKTDNSVLLVLKPTLLSLPPGQQAASREIWLGSETRPRTPL